MTDITSSIDASRADGSCISVVCDRRTYLGWLYLILALPLGVLEAVIVIVGLLVGGGFSPVPATRPFAAKVWRLMWRMMRFERMLANRLLRAGIRPVDCSLTSRHPATTPSNGGQRRFWNRATAKGLTYLVAKLPLGILSFAVALMALAFTLGVLSLPVTALMGDGMPGGRDTIIAGQRINSAWEWAAWLLVAPPVVIMALHLTNSVASAWASFGRLLLGGPPASISTLKAHEPAASVAVAPTLSEPASWLAS